MKIYWGRKYNSMMNKSINKDIKHWYNVWKLPFHIDTPDYCLYIFDKNGEMIMSYAGQYNEPYKETVRQICNILNDDGGEINSPLLRISGLYQKISLNIIIQK